MSRNTRLGILAPAFLAIIVDSMGYGIVYPLMTELFAGEEGRHMAKGLSQSLRHFYLGLSFLLFPLAAFFGTPFMSNLSHSYGRKKILILCMSGLTLSFLLMGIGVEFIDISLLFIGRALSGFMAGSQPLAQAIIIEKSPAHTKSKNLAILTFVISIGIVIGPFIGGVFSDTNLVSFFNLSTPFYIAAALALLTTVWIALAFSQTIETGAQKQPLHVLRPLNIFYEGFVRKETRFLAFILLFMQIGFSLFYQLIQVFVSVVYEYSSWKIGIFNGYLGIAFALVVLFGIKFFIKYFTIEIIAVISLALSGLFLVLSMLYSKEFFVWAMAFLASGFDMMAYGALMACFSSAVDKSDQTWIMGVFTSIIAATWAVTGFSTNLIPILGLHGLIILGGIFMLLSSFLMLFYLKVTKAPVHKI